MADTEPESQVAKVTRWRRHVLLEAGYPARDARRIADRHDIDLRLAERLLKNGCAVRVAVKILL